MRAPAEDTVVDGGTRRLATFASSLTFDDIPRAVVEHAKLCLLDTVGCGLWRRVRHDQGGQV